MIKEKIKEKLYNIISDLFGIKIEDIHLNSNFEKDFNADSLDGVELVMQVEDDFKIRIKDKDATNFLTVESILNYLEKEILENDKT